MSASRGDWSGQAEAGKEAAPPETGRKVGDRTVILWGFTVLGAEDGGDGGVEALGEPSLTLAVWFLEELELETLCFVQLLNSMTDGILLEGWPPCV